MSDDIILDKITEIVIKYTKNCKVDCYYESGNYYISLIDNAIFIYKLHPIYLKHEDYLLRVISDLCIKLANANNKLRNDYFNKKVIN